MEPFHECTSDSAFFALLGRTQLIQRWSLMRNSWKENVQEHSFQVALIAQALVFIRDAYYPEAGPKLDPDKILALSLFHDVTEVLTGDLPTPVKYHDDQLRNAYKQLEVEASDRLLRMLPEALRASYAPYFSDLNGSEEEREMKRFIKAADKISALIKCELEKAQGNREFDAAAQQTFDRISELSMVEADHFIRCYLPYYTKNIDHYDL